MTMNVLHFLFELDATLLRSEVENLFKETETIILTIQIGREQKEVMEPKPVFNKEKNQIEWSQVPTGRYEPVRARPLYLMTWPQEKGIY